MNQNSGDITTSLVQSRFDDRTTGTFVWISPQIKHFGFKQYFFEQFRNTQTGFGRNVVRLVFSAPALHHVVHVGQLMLDLFRICGMFVNLVDGKYDWNTGSRSMVDGLDGLRHHVVVGCYNDNGNVSNLGTTGTHGGKRLVTRCIEESNLSAIFEFHIVRTDVLGDTTRFTCNYVGFTNVVEQRCLTVVDVSHDCDDRWTRFEICFRIFFFQNGFLNFNGDELYFIAKFICHNRHGFGIQTLVDGYEKSERHTGCNNLSRVNVHHAGKFTDRNKLCNFDDISVDIGLCTLFRHLLRVGKTFVATVFGSSCFLAFGGKTGKGLFDLLLYIFLVDLFFKR